MPNFDNWKLLIDHFDDKTTGNCEKENLKPDDFPVPAGFDYIFGLFIIMTCEGGDLRIRLRGRVIFQIRV